MDEIKEYLDEVKQRFEYESSREHAYRGALQTLLTKLLPDILITNEPARSDCGAPDYILTRKNVPVGYIEAKDLGNDLDNKAYKEQFNRYRNSLPNLIITNYLTFRFYRDGEKVTELSIGEVKDNDIILIPDNYRKFIDLITDFVAFNGQTITSSSKLAKMMAGKARLMANVLAEALTSDEESEADTTLRQQLKAFREVLLHDITATGFADIYSQTIAYGMFAARLHDPTLEDFSRQEAAELIPKTNPFLRKLFHYIAGYDLDQRIDWIVDDLADIFRATDVASLLKNFGKTTQRNDPFLHFYETFLAEYDPKLRKSRGVWYTPEPVVNFIVRAVDDILKTEFNIKDGLADTRQTTINIKTDKKDKRTKSGYVELEKQVHKVQILDPATGTGTFLAEVIKHIHEKFVGQQGIWNGYVQEHLIPRINGFELLMAPYAMAHLKLDLLLSETGYKPDKDKEQRLRVFLTNSLEEHHPDTGTLFATWLADEANEANHVKRDTPVMVVLGNPPYSGESANKGDWIMGLMDDYKKEPGGKEKLNERNPKWINDDYVKFIRCGQHYVEKNGEGILAYINNHSFLDNPTFRGMRWHLLNTFDKIYILDLHGNSKKKETCPDGSQDKNVFDIQQGVSINLFIKTNEKKKQKLANVYHCDLFGTREFKYDYLWEHNLDQIKFKKIELPAPLYFFAQKDFELQDKYDEGFQINELFPVNSVGIVTARDSFSIQHTPEEVKEVINTFVEMDTETAREHFNLGKDVKDWKVNLAKKDLADSKLDFDTKLVPISYRPFDLRYTYYTGTSTGFHCRPRGEVMNNYLPSGNVGLVVGRQGQVVGNMQWNLIFATENITDFNLYYRGGGVTFPLFINKATSKQHDIDSSETNIKPNFDETIVSNIEKYLSLKLSPDKEDFKTSFAPIDILDYIYAVLHSPKYREAYKEFLKIDFPRVPYPEDAGLFWKLVALGSELRQIHLLESPVVEQFITTYPVNGNNEITRPIGKNDFKMTDAKQKTGQVWINNEQYFSDVPVQAWEFYIGGYQPAQKWLKDRKGRTLDHNDIFHYQKIIVALTETNRIMNAIDELDWLT